MALGKRKREAVPVRRDRVKDADSGTASPVEDANDVFRKYFEAQFDPLPQTMKRASSLEQDSSDVDDEEAEISDENTEFGGFSDSEDVTNGQSPVVEIVDAGHLTMDGRDDVIEKIFKKSFMGSKAPRDITQPTASAVKANESDEETSNLKHDLDLQRLLRESHLLSQSRTTSTTALSGKHRHQAIDLRMQDLGSKNSLFAQEKMPMLHRKGISATKDAREAHRRRDARENGVILEKEKRKGTDKSRRDRGVDAPILGKFKNGTLELSRRDIASIQGPNSKGRGGKKGKRRGK